MPSVEQRKLDVFARGSTRQEIKALENKPEFTVADIGQLIAIKCETSVLSRRYCPRVGRSRQPRRFIRVDFPEPLAPIRATNSPRLISRDTPRTAGTSTSPVR